MEPLTRVHGDATDPSREPASTAIRLRGARKVYRKGAASMVALDGVAVSIDSGRVVSVIGPSGCGKSTLLRLVAGLESPDEGEVSIFGVSPERAGAAKTIGLVPQNPALLPWLNVLQNVSLPSKINRRADRRRAAAEGAEDAPQRPDMIELLHRAGLGEAAHKLPEELSGGMKQRAAIVRAFGLQPKVLLMDEPFSALDEFTRESLQGQLLDLWQQMRTTVVFVTHSVSEAVRLSDTVIVMAAKPGRITDVIDIDLARPRGQEMLKSVDFHHYEDLIRDRLQTAWRSPSAGSAA